MPHYEVEQTSEYEYTFCTDKGVKYILSFVYVGCGLPIYAFNIGRTAERKSNGDGNLIMNTVAYVLNLFFESDENAILSTCDVDDGCASARYRLFRMWYNKINDDTIVKKEQKIPSGEDGSFTWALLYYKKSSILASCYEQHFDEYTELMGSV